MSNGWFHITFAPLADTEFGKNAANLSNHFAASTKRRFQFQKSRQLFIRVHNETLSVAAMGSRSRAAVV